MIMIAALAVALNLLLAPTVDELTLARVAEFEQGLDLNAVLASRIARDVPPHGRLPPVSELSRSYSFTQVSGRLFILGEFTLPRGSIRPGAYLRDPVGATDGGCNVVWVVFDQDTGRPVGAWCNGLA